jgi:tripartite ATP-independent transporter DctM subunit
MVLALLFGVFALLLALGVPVAFSLCAASLATILYLGLPADVFVIETAAGTDSTTLIAIPLFILAGQLMLHGGISAKLIAFANSLVGHVRGGLAQVNVLSCLFFGGVSGSAIADVSAVGGSLIPQMVERGYDRDYAVNVTISAALVALLVPPSHNLVLYSAAAGGAISIADLFAAGVVPALLLMIAIMVTAYLIARRRGYATENFPGIAAVATRLIAALPGLLLVFLIFGGIRLGIFTAVESASIAVLYALVVTALLYRNLPFSEFVKAVASAAQTAGIILFVISSAAAFGWLLAYLQVPAAAVAAIRTIADDPLTVLMLMNVVLLVLGTFMDMAPLIIICTPIFLPVASAFGVNPLQFGTVLILNAGIGLITPPVGSVLFVGTAIGKIGIAQAMRTIWPFYAAALVVLLLVTYLPQLSLWLPGALR